MLDETNAKSMSIIVTKGTLDWAYPPFILATTAAAMGLEVTMFFTFYGLTLLKKDLNLKINPLGNAGDGNADGRHAHGDAEHHGGDAGGRPR